MPWKWKPNVTLWKKDTAKQHQRTEYIAQQYYRNRLRQDRAGDADNDWAVAEKITQNPVRRLLFSSSCLWIKIKPLIPIGLLFSAAAVGFTWWLEHETEVRQRTTSQNLNHQRIFESYISNIKEISLSRDYKDTVELLQERTFIRGITLPVLRELTHDEERKAQLVLFLYQLQMCEILSENGCKKLESSEMEESNIAEPGQTDANSGSQANPRIAPSSRAPKILQTADLKFGKFRGYQLPDISFLGADLRGADFESADLTNASLISANLSCHQRSTQAWWSWIPLPIADAREIVCGNLHGAQLQGAGFVGAKLRGTDLSNANLSGANLQVATITTSTIDYQTETSLGNFLKNIWPNRFKRTTVATITGANFSDANLSGADLSETNLKGALLLNTDLTGVKGLTEAQLTTDPPPLLCHGIFSEGSDLEYLKDRDCDNLQDIDLSSSYLQNIDLSGANLSGANLSEANLSGANLKNSTLSGANLSNAIFLGTDLSETQGLTPEQLSGNNPPLLCNVILPETLDDTDLKDRDCNILDISDG